MAPACYIWDLDPVLVSLGPLHIRWYGLFFAMVLLGGYLFLEWQFKRAKLSDEFLTRYVVYTFFGFLLGAYLGHRVFYEWDKLIADPIGTLLPSGGGISGLASHGATIGIILAAWLFHRRSKIPMIEIIDRVTFTVALGSILVRLGNFANSEIVGRVTTSSWAVCFPRFDGHNTPRHPSQLYEAVMGLVMLIILLAADRQAGGEKRRQGLLGGLFLAMYFTMRFVVEFFKEYQTLDPSKSPLTMGQYLSIPAVLAGIGLILYSRTAAAAPRPLPAEPSAPSSRGAAGHKGKGQSSRKPSK